jgi:hypothetical protein
MRTQWFRFLGLVSVIVAATLACSLSETGRQIEGVRQTAEQAIGQGQQAIATIQALATQYGPLLSTAQAFATQNPGLVSTGQALATQHAPLIETAKALATEQGPGALQTAQAIATQVAVGQPPEDIPILARETAENFFASRDVVSYITALPYETVRDFYKQAMPAAGWTEMPAESAEAEGAVVLKYGKPERVAVISLTFQNGKTHVLISIQVR